MSFDTTVTLGNVIQVSFFLVLIVGAYFKLDKKIELVRNEVKHVWRELNRFNGSEE